MDGYEPIAGHEASRFGTADGAGSGEPRSFLFLQGPISSFFDRLARVLIARGHRVHRVNLHLGDRLFWHLPASNYRGRFEDWRAFVGGLMEQHRITDLVLHGDRRPYHIVAAEEARARGIAVIATDLGYVRPDWITLEYDGMTTYSRFPRDPAAIRALAAELPAPDLEPRFHTPFWLIASLDIAYNVGLVFGRLLYPHYRYHSVCHPFAEYAGWLWSRAKRLFTARSAAAAKQRLQAAPGSYFLVPLQLSTDFQIRAHSPYRNVGEAVAEIVASFAASGCRKKLLFVVHPLDNGLIGWSRLIGRLARQCAVEGQVLALHGGTPTSLLRNAAGVVTINSTVGVTALHYGVPVKALGSAVFDVAGLTCQAPLDAFWHDPQRPDPELMAAFLRALVGATQVKGSYYERASQDCAIAGFVARLEERPYPLPPLTAAVLAARAPRAPSQTVVVGGVSGAIGLALARAHAAPGVKLCLIGTPSRTLDRAAADCRQRGAQVETVRLDGGAGSAAAAALDKCVALDALVVNVAGDAAPGDQAARDLVAAIEMVATLAEPMRRRGRGEVVLVGGGVSRAATAALRRAMRADGVALAVVAPSRIAVRAAAWLRAPRLSAADADRIAGQSLRARGRRRAVIIAPGVATIALRALLAAPSRLRETLRDALLPSVAAIREPVDKAPLADESGSGD
ncbi:MAG TPA: SDR family NAD(P)-dependent oxidoreductase [Stellaceae bacterium]|jgi:capsular polysaccharide export protein|nr:SDR family NAD(P)-dependent oxidoreductase [Stellaceae bacterium]